VVYECKTHYYDECPAICRHFMLFSVTHKGYFCIKNGEGKISTTPRRHMGKWRYRSMHYQPQHYKEVSG